MEPSPCLVLTWEYLREEKLNTSSCEQEKRKGMEDVYGKNEWRNELQLC